MVPWSRRRRVSVSSLAFAGWTRRFRRAGDPGTTVTRSVSARVRRHDVAREYGARTAKERLPLTLIGSGPDMRKVIDLECDLPPDENGNPRKLEAATHPPGYGDLERLPPLPGHGFSNYARIFTRRGDGATGTEAEPENKSGMSIADFIGMMDRAGVEIGVLRAGNAIITDILAQYP